MANVCEPTLGRRRHCCSFSHEECDAGSWLPRFQNLTNALCHSFIDVFPNQDVYIRLEDSCCQKDMFVFFRGSELNTDSQLQNFFRSRGLFFFSRSTRCLMVRMHVNAICWHTSSGLASIDYSPTGRDGKKCQSKLIVLVILWDSWHRMPLKLFDFWMEGRLSLKCFAQFFCLSLFALPCCS